MQIEPFCGHQAPWLHTSTLCGTQQILCQRVVVCQIFLDHSIDLAAGILIPTSPSKQVVLIAFCMSISWCDWPYSSHHLSQHSGMSVCTNKDVPQQLWIPISCLIGHVQPAKMEQMKWWGDRCAKGLDGFLGVKKVTLSVECWQSLAWRRPLLPHWWC